MNQKIDVVITMGGLGSRFRKAGYQVPKYMIEARGKTLFDWSILSLKGYEKDVCQYIFIVMEDESQDVSGFIKTHCKNLGITNYHVILLDYLTDGQATTAMLAEKYWQEDHGLLIYNIDTYVEPGEMNVLQLKGDGFIPCFIAPGDHWSFVKCDDHNKAVEIREKVRIAEHCTLGAYYFKSCKLYQQLYNEYYVNGEKHEEDPKEKYVAPLYEYLISKGGDIYICDVPIEKVHVLGTPEELNQFINNGEKRY